MGTTELVNAKDSIEKGILMIHWSGWRNEPKINSCILRSGIERVNIRPRKLFLVPNLGDNTIKEKIRIWYNNTIFLFLFRKLQSLVIYSNKIYKLLIDLMNFQRSPRSRYYSVNTYISILT